MIITDFGFFRVIEPPPGNRVLLFQNDMGLDWYEMRRALTQWDQPTGEFVNAVYGTWAMADADGYITNVETDPSRLMPGDRRVLGIDADPGDIYVGLIYRDGDLYEEMP